MELVEELYKDDNIRANSSSIKEYIDNYKQPMKPC